MKKSGKNYDFTKQDVGGLSVNNIVDEITEKELKKNEFKKQIEYKMSVAENKIIDTKNSHSGLDIIIGVFYEDILKHLPYDDAIKAFNLFPEKAQKNNIVKDYIENNKPEEKVETPNLKVESPQINPLVSSCLEKFCNHN